MPDADVVVCGLGPTGATVSSLLAQRGLRVIAFEKSRGLFPLPRAIGMDHEAMRILQELKIADVVLPHTALYQPSEYRGVQGQVIRRIEPAPPPLRFGWHSNYVFDQPEFERALQRKLHETAGIDAHYATSLISVMQHDDYVEVGVECDGVAETCSSRLLLACDGGSSPVRKLLGIVLQDLGFDEYWLVVDANVSEGKIHELPQTQVQYCEPRRPCSYVIGPGNHRRWEIMLLPGDSLSPEFPEQELWPLLARWIKPGEAVIRRAAAYRFHGLVTPEWRRHRVLLLGDAAHMTPPFMSQGMVQGMRDGHNLAWKIERVLNDRSPMDLLDTYGQERGPHVAATTQAAMSLGREICERDPQRAFERDAALGALAVNGVLPPTIRQNLIPPLRSGLLISETPGAGELCPQPRVRAWGQPQYCLLDDVTEVTTRLISCASLTECEAGLLNERLSALPGCLIHILDAGRVGSVTPLTFHEEGRVLRRWFESLDQTFALVRPDHYVYGTAASCHQALKLIGDFLAQLRSPWP